ncbi:MAG: ABC transporter permease, partial [Thermoguttaceae bacterium]
TGKKVIRDELYIKPGDDVTLTFPTAGSSPKAATGKFTVVDIFESRMAEHDQKLVFVPIDKLQELCGMIDPETKMRWASQILIKAKPGVNIVDLRNKIKAAFPDSYQMAYSVQTWQDCQKSIIDAVFTEVAILNVLLFLILSVAGFGILAIFFMIVVEKTKDIGILKSLGASGTGIMQIFLMYSVSLGIVGSGLGVVIGLLFIHYIKEIAEILSWFMGHSVFDPAVYSFTEIPTIVQPHTIIFIVLGAVFIAVCAGIFPALRAAKMKPVESLRS